jgi:hypothetical protein
MHLKMRRERTHLLGPFYWVFHVIVELSNDLASSSDKLRMVSSNCFFLLGCDDDLCLD